MNPSVRLLEETGSALRSALASQDWAAIGELDMQCRQAVEEAMAEPTRDDELLRARMEELLELYRELVTLCQEEGSIHPSHDPDQVVEELVVLHRGALFEWRIYEGRFDLPQLGRRMARQLLRGLHYAD